MRHPIHSAILTGMVLVATSAFAASKATVNIPFSFSSQGHSYPAGQYVATLDTTHNVLALSNKTETAISARWVVGPADYNPNEEHLTLKFDDLGNSHTLRTVQLGPRITSRLDAPARHHDAGATATVSGQ
ncbi:MAG TPA: hypothetical protein VGT04_13755 [Acidobacteriaceae bacterium]|nr:hypothetical protein [Acidobacteriaceae bacterium]